jgi:hypothetical protein
VRSLPALSWTGKLPRAARIRLFGEEGFPVPKAARQTSILLSGCTDSCPRGLLRCWKALTHLAPRAAERVRKQPLPMTHAPDSRLSRQAERQSFSPAQQARMWTTAALPLWPAGRWPSPGLLSARSPKSLLTWYPRVSVQTIRTPGQRSSWHRTCQRVCAWQYRGTKNAR